MTTKRLKDLNRNQLETLLKVNHAHLIIRKGTPLKKLRAKFNLLGGEFANVTFDRHWNIIPNHQLRNH